MATITNYIQGIDKELIINRFSFMRYFFGLFNYGSIVSVLLQKQTTTKDKLIEVQGMKKENKSNKKQHKKRKV
jgi:hypothetical protein